MEKAKRVVVLVVALIPLIWISTTDIISWDECVYVSNAKTIIGVSEVPYHLHRPPLLSLLLIPFLGYEWLLIWIFHLLVIYFLVRILNPIPFPIFCFPFLTLLLHDDYRLNSLSIYTEIGAAAGILACYWFYHNQYFILLGIFTGLLSLLKFNLFLFVVIWPIIYFINLFHPKPFLANHFKNGGLFFLGFGSVLFIYGFTIWVYTNHPFTQISLNWDINFGELKSPPSISTFSQILYYPLGAIFLCGITFPISILFFFVTNYFGTPPNPIPKGIPHIHVWQPFLISFLYILSLLPYQKPIFRLLLPILPILLVGLTFLLGRVWEKGINNLSRPYFAILIGFYGIGLLWGFHQDRPIWEPKFLMSGRDMVSQWTSPIVPIIHNPVWKTYISQENPAVIYSDDFWLAIEAHFHKRVIRVRTPTMTHLGIGKPIEPEEIPEGALVITKNPHFFPPGEILVYVADIYLIKIMHK